ncbi:CG32039 [Drosophila busckii]|uniref:CG32039 n=1 Tax=Drosophila busckii TaxID=30019 RepID=A0A0M4E998_DROBS|nr:CG32039 [Drosophila busckii]
MGMCTSCCGNSAEEANLMPSPEERRRQQLDAAEKRRQENETRGVKNLDSVRRQQQRTAELERREAEAARQGGNSPTLRWQTS